jgi:hypothetical protein
MTQQTAEKTIRNWFWTFKEKLVDEYPEYHSSFDLIISKSSDYGLLWEVLEFAYRYLEVDVELKGGLDNLNATDYMAALDYGYGEWIK